MSSKPSPAVAAACLAGCLGYLLYLRQRRAVREAQTATSARAVQSYAQTRLRAASNDVLEGRNMVIVQVPATSANMGSGYDCIGMALDMWNELRVERASKFSLTVEGEGADSLPRDESNLVCVAVRAAFRAAGKEVPPLKYHLTQRIPHGRGLGSSSAAIVAGLLAGLAIAGHQLDVQGQEHLLQLATEIEGHPDNVAPAMYGGIQLGLYNNDKKRWETERLPIPSGLIFVAFIPDFVGKTSELRQVVPKTLPLEDAVFNMGRFGWFINALNTGKLKNLREGLKDRLHQPHRAKAVYKHLYPIVDAAYDAGAVGAYLSGAGPVVMAMVHGGYADYFTQSQGQKDDLKVAMAMQAVADEMKVPGRVYITHPTTVGGVITQADPPYSNDLVTFNGAT